MQNFEGVQNFLTEQLPATLDLLRQMVEMNSFTANKEGVNRLGDLTARTFSPLGFNAQTVPSVDQEYGDHLVLTRKGKSDCTIALISHLDTVFPPEEEKRNNFHWQVEGDRIFGPGTQDIKGGTAMMWLVLSALRAQAPHALEGITWKVLWDSFQEEYLPDLCEVFRSRICCGTVV